MNENFITSDFLKVKSTLVDKNNQLYSNFINSLHPNYFIVWRDIFFGYFFLILSLFLSNILHGFGLPYYITFIIGSISVGYWFAYINLFMHEAAHFNIVKNRKINDILANVFICVWVGMNINKYRFIHLQHHSNLGTVKDTERSYFEPLTIRFFLKGIFLYKLVKTFLNYDKVQIPKNKMGKNIYNLLISIIIHLFIIICCFIFIGYGAVISWIIGVICFFPLFLSLRQVLEHRSETAGKDISYDKVEHGETNRIFKNSIFSLSFGGAGFNKHLLHHWEPKLSYTNLPKLEIFLRNTKIAIIIEKNTTTYTKTFFNIFQGL